MDRRLLAIPFLCALVSPPGSAQSAERPVRLERVDDVAVAQLYADGFENLTLDDQRLCWHLAQAAIAGRDIFFQQHCADGLLLRDTLEEILTHADGIDAPTLAELRSYTTLFWVNNGPYNAMTARKNLLECTPEAFSSALEQAARNGARLGDHETGRAGRFAGSLSALALARGRGERVEPPDDGDANSGAALDTAALAAHLSPWLFDPAFEPMVTAKNPVGGLDVVQASACTYYGEGVTLADLEGFQERYPLNSTVVKGSDGKLTELVWRAGSPEDDIPPGLYAREIEGILGHLSAALPFAPAPTRAALEKLMRFYRTGEEADREAYDIAWVADNASPVDTVNGFIEVYVDPRGLKGGFEGIVSYEDPKKAALIKGLAESAQWFEDRMPFAAEYRKAQVKGISARSIDVICETGDSGPVTPIGINLPNDQRIREEHGSKSVSLANVVAANAALTDVRVHQEFCWDAAEVERATRWGSLTGELHTNMHEVIGHASGQQDTEHPGDPASFIQEDYSALEEARADLVSLAFMADPKLKELGLVDDPATAALAAYENYTRNALLQQLRRIRTGNQIEQDHMRNRHMVASWILHNSDAIETRTRDGKHFYVVKDATAWQQAAGRLLAEVQRIKSTGDRAAAAALFDEHGDTFDPALRDEVLARYATLDVASYTGFVQPRLSPVWGADGALADVTIDSPLSLGTQMLEWSGRALPPVALPEDPGALFHTALQRLLAATDVELSFEAVADGAVTAKKRGTLALRTGNRLRWHFEGDFAGQASTTDVHSDGRQLAVTRGDGEPSSASTPPRLNAGIVHGMLTRGLLHNIAFLALGRGIDVSDGTPVGVSVHDFAALPDGEVDGEPVRRLAYVMRLGDQAIGEAQLDVSQATGLPVRREQTVHFGEGDMHVVERYSWVRPVRR